MQPLNFIKEYYGEKYGFYFAWLIHYTGQLIIPSILGLIFFIAQVVKREEGMSISQMLNTTENFYYALIILVWSTYLVESWKRK